MSTGSPSRYSRAQFAKDLGLADVTGLDWTEILLVANPYGGDSDISEVSCALDRLISGIVPASSDPDVFTARDLSAMYREWLCRNQGSWITMSSFIVPFRQWTLAELMPYVAALVNKVDPIPEVQGLFFALALTEARTFDELEDLFSYASTKDQRKAVLKKMPDDFTASTKQLLWFASETDTSREVCEELVRREVENPNLNATNFSELIDVYEVCLPFPDLAMRMHKLMMEEGMRNVHLYPMSDEERFPVVQEILENAPKDSLLFSEALLGFITVGLEMKNDTFLGKIDFKTVATLEFRLRGDLSAHEVAKYPPRPVASIRMAQQLMLDAMEKKVNSRADAMTLLAAVKQDGGERFIRACALVKLWSAKQE